MRVVSLLPASTEIVCALGAEPLLVGRSHECDYPGTVRGLPSLTTPRLDPHAPSRVIEDRVQELLSRALSIYEVDAGLLRELAPDIIITQTHCEVCAASTADVEAALRDWIGPRPRLVSLSPGSLSEVWEDVRRVAEALGRAPAGEALLGSLRARQEAVIAATRGRPRPRVACIEWLDPLMAAGNWIPTLVEQAGGACLFGQEGAHSPWITWEALQAADPEVLAIFPCGFDLARTRQEIGALTGLPGWGRLRAVENRRAYLIDGNQYLNRPGPRLVDSLEILASICHPGVVEGAYPGVEAL